VGEHTLGRLRAHAEYLDERLTYATPAMQHAYFGSTYINPETDRLLKQKINTLYRERFAGQKITNKPRLRRIGVITQFWRLKHVVYRAFKPLLQQLGDDYELVLIHLGAKGDKIDASLFSEVRFFSMDTEPYNFGAITPNDFAMVIYPDVGMCIESICLSNMRLAPIQVATYGHPVSTWGSQIDYFMGGSDVEIAHLAQENYSERLVLVPGCGQANTRPDYEPKIPDLADTPLRIACCWAAQKINFPHLLRLKAACENVGQPVKFVFSPFASNFDNDNSYIPMERDIAEIMGSDFVEVQRPLPYEKYLESLEECHFAVDSFPFGGYSTAIDLLWLHKPLVTLRGKHANNRVAAYLLERMGLNQLIADTPEEFVQLLRRMITDAEFRNNAITHARKLDREHVLLSLDHAHYWRKAIGYLLENHGVLEQETSRMPIYIEH
jgi:predicted O-linked N-acetylglucosamine transferase (SPINDLY family)